MITIVIITVGSNHWRTYRWPGYAVAYPKPALLYPNDLFDLDLIKFELQLDINYIDDIRHKDNFIGLTNLVNILILVQTGKHKIYDMVYNLLKLVLLLPVAMLLPKASFSLVQIQKHLSPLLLLTFGHTNYCPATDYVDTGSCSFFRRSLLRLVTASSLAPLLLPSYQCATSLV